MKTFRIVFVFAFVSAISSLAVAADKMKFEADLSGAKVPPVATLATGEASFELVHEGFFGKGSGGTGEGSEGKGAGGVEKGDALHYKLSVRDIENVTAAHLHKGSSTDSEGPVVAPLYTGAKKSGEFSGDLVEGTIRAEDLKGPLAGKSIPDLVALMQSGEVYVNVHTAKHPKGEIRGQVKKES